EGADRKKWAAHERWGRSRRSAAGGTAQEVGFGRDVLFALSARVSDRHIGDALARSRGRRGDRASAPEQVGHWWRPLLRRLGEVMTDPWKLDPSGPLPIAPPEYNQRARTQASAVLPRLSHEGRRVLELAEEEARVGDSNHLGTEHIVLGIFRHESGPASALLRSLGITREVFVAQLYEEEGQAPEGAIPLTPRALTIIGFAGTFTTGPVEGLHLLRGTIVESEEWLASGRPGSHHLRKACEAVGLPWQDLDAAVSRRLGLR
ncbi:MAG TPA: Clp protease N-terminal domain-containing protein, partial [Actinomycetota bacterium]|nr:Clp protease N-terminal domain-containing protein [Actinomycetota bacterium]